MPKEDMVEKSATTAPLTRREFLDKVKNLGLAAIASKLLIATDHLPSGGGEDIPEDSQTAELVDTLLTSTDQITSLEPLPHQQFINRIQSSPEYSEQFNLEFKGILERALRSCVTENGEWVIPSNHYSQYYFSRDSYWALAAAKDKQLLNIAARRFHEDQKGNPDGHIATALYRNGSYPENRDRDDESTMMDVLREWERKQTGETPDKESLSLSYKFITSHIKNGRYVTTGETRSGPPFQGDDEIGTYHYWADTYRPAGKAVATPEVIAYNQGLLCVVLRCLQEMGVPVDPRLPQRAETVYANMTNTEDGISLPQRENSSVMDVSALVGEALSLYYFDRPLLSDQHVAATIEQLAKVFYPDRKFLGFKVISDYYGEYRPQSEYSGSSDNWKGNYQRGGSWFLYDELALYAGIRHNIPGLVKFFIQRMQSEVRFSKSSHEFIRTSHEGGLGGSDKLRDDYGWNAFIFNFLP